MANYEFRILLLISLSYLVGYSSSKSCFAKEKNPYKLFATKTAYNQIRGFGNRDLEYPGCRPVQFYMLARHGTRYPKEEDITLMRQRLPLIRDAIVVAAANKKGKLCKEDIDNLKLWHFHLQPDGDDQRLAPTGENELKGIGLRFRARFSNFFNNIRPKKNQIDVRVTTTERTKSSAKFLIKGLLGEEGNSVSSVEDNDLLRFYKDCPLWKKLVTKNEEAFAEVHKFKTGSAILEVQKDVSKRLGLKSQLSLNDIQLMYDSCRFEAAWDEDSVSPWCAAFENDDLKTLEYAEDLKCYFKHGYAHTINYDQACPPIKDLIDRFSSKIANNQSEPTILLRLSHSGMLLKVIAKLGLFKDVTALTSSNYKRQKNRAWRTSHIDSFASNLVFVLLNCRHEHRVVTFFQERELALPGCITTPCPIAEFLHAFQTIADNCNLKEICN